ncbi:MAG TPA: GNAT family N-acetyltransferase [Actinomycetota bacterium]|nr:GNAT family N-acetyltransferase [Actinomycetota bacterium]
MTTSDLEPLVELWRAHDAAFEHVAPEWWGAVVGDRRYPAIHEANYSRVEARSAVRLAEIDGAIVRTTPGSARSHVVLFYPEDQTALIAEAGSRGDRLLWDLVMVHRDPPAAIRSDTSSVGIQTEEIRRFDDTFWRAHAESVRLFAIEDPETLVQLQALERETMIPFGRRWFTVQQGGAPVAFGALLVVGDTAYVDHVVTFPRARRRGYAEALTRRALAEATKAGVTSTFLLAEPGGQAERIYRRIGFEPVAHLASWTTVRE